MVLLINQRGAGPAADQRHSAAVHFLRRIKLVRDAGQRGRVVEREPANGVGGNWKVLGGGTGNYISTSSSYVP